MSFEPEIIDRILDAAGRTADRAIPVLQAIQEAFQYVPLESISYVAEHSDMSEAQLYGVATFYAQFRMAPVGRYHIRVCHGTACHVAGAEGITGAIEGHLGIRAGDTTRDGLFTLSAVACLGCCSLAPVMVVNETTYGRLDRAKTVEILESLREAADA
jgi:NADH:ubiquinone oxidoreductase subunit E